MIVSLVIHSVLAHTPCFPVQVGTEWQYELDSAGVKGELQQRLDASTSTANGWVITLRNSMKFGSTSSSAIEQFRVSEEGVWRISGPFGEVSPPMLIAGLAQNQDWSGTLSSLRANSTASGEYRVIGATELSVVAGTFSVTETQATLGWNVEGQRVSSQCRYWLAPGVGFVQVEAQFTAGIVLAKLKKFRRG